MIPKFMAVALTLASMAGIAHAQQTASARADVLVKTDASWNGVAYTTYPTGLPS